MILKRVYSVLGLAHLLMLVAGRPSVVVAPLARGHSPPGTDTAVTGRSVEGAGLAE